jgi:predicted GIY-YIG superfamily endonuclease
MWYAYLLKCQDRAIYTGITDNVERRFEEHVSGKGGHYTNYNRPKELLYKESFESRIDAEQREAQIKRWSRAKKLALIKGDRRELRNLNISRLASCEILRRARLNRLA